MSSLLDSRLGDTPEFAPLQIKKREDGNKESSIKEPGKKTAEAGKEPDISEEISRSDIEEMIEFEKGFSEEEDERADKHRKILRKIFTVLLSLACVYLVILIYGTWITQFEYDENGKIIPVILSADEIAERNDYNTILGVYLKTREIYEKILSLDYRAYSQTEDQMRIAPEYEAVLNKEISPLIVQIEGIEINSSYSQVRNMMLSWLAGAQTEEAPICASAYCQKMSIAISEQNNDAANDAAVLREGIKSNFRLITENVIILGSGIRGADISGLTDWDPETYINETYVIAEN